MTSIANRRLDLRTRNERNGGRGFFPGTLIAGLPRRTSVYLEANAVIFRQIREFIVREAVQPLTALGGLESSHGVQRAVGGVVVVDWTGVAKFQQTLQQFFSLFNIL